MGLNPSQNVLGDSISGLGFSIAFYYGLTGLASLVYFRKEVFSSAKNFLLAGLVPLLGFVLMAGIFVKAFHDYSQKGFNYSEPVAGIQVPIAIGIGSLLLGVVLMVLAWVTMPEFFKRKPELAPAGALEVKEEAVVFATTSTTRSSDPGTVVADVSHLLDLGLLLLLPARGSYGVAAARSREPTEKKPAGRDRKARHDHAGRTRPQPGPDLRHDAARRRAVARDLAQHHREARDRPPARAAGRRHHRGRLPDLLAGRLRGGAGDRPTGPRPGDRRPGTREPGRRRSSVGGGPRAERPRIHTFVSTSDIHIVHQLQSTREDVKGLARAAVAQAKGYLDDVEFSPMDATRADVGSPPRSCRSPSRRAPPRSTSPTRSATRCRTSTRPS